MKKLAKSVLSLTLCLMMVLTALSPSAGIVTVSAADSGTCGDNLTWTLDDEGTLTISGEGEMYHYSNPNYAPWYSYRNSIKNVIIEDGVTSIGDFAFAYCSGLESIEISEGVTSIGVAAFRDCSKLESIEIPEGVTSIGKVAFGYCELLKSIIVDEENTAYDSRNSCNAIIETATNTLVAGCKSTVIPTDVTSIGDYAFGCCSGLESIEIPEGVTSIGEGAFGYCPKLESIEIPDSVTLIGKQAFQFCIWLESIEIPASVTSIGIRAFYYSGLTSIEIPASVTSIGEAAFCGCEGLTSIEIPEGVTSIGDWAFCECSALTCIEIPDSVISIGLGVFAYCEELTSIKIPASVTSIDDWAFDYCDGLTDVYYGGTEADKAKIEIAEGNGPLTDAKWHFNSPVIGLNEAKLIMGNAQNNQMTYAYKTAVTFRANVPEGGSVQWYIDDEEAGTGATLSVPAKTKGYTVTVVVTDADGLKTFDEEEVTIKSSFIDMIIYFFRHLFNPAAYIVEQK